MKIAHLSIRIGFNICSMLISTPSLGVYYFLSLTLSICPSVCLSVCLSQTLLLLFLFLNGIEPFLGHQFYMTKTTKSCSSIFDLGPLTPKIDSPKFDQKSPITRLVWQIDRRWLRLIRGFRGWPIQWNHVQCCEADPCCYDNNIWANLGYFSTKSPMSRLVCQIDQICLGLPAETNSGDDLCCQGNDI